MTNKALQTIGKPVLPDNYRTFHDLAYSQRYQLATQFVTGKSVLDVGCGKAKGAFLLHQANAQSVTAVDYDLKTITAAKKHYPGINFITDNAETLASLRNTRYDIITSFDTIENIPNAKLYCKRLAQLLTEDGLLFLSAPNSEVSAKADQYPMQNLTEAELTTLLTPYFKHIRVFYQHDIGASVVTGPGIKKTLLPIYETSLTKPGSYIVIASQKPIPSLPPVPTPLIDVTRYIQQELIGPLANQQKQIKKLTDSLIQSQTHLQEILTSKKFRLLQKTVQIKLVLGRAKNNPQRALTLVDILMHQGPKGVIAKLKQVIFLQDINVQYKTWLLSHTPTSKELNQQTQDAKALAYKPVISILTPTYNTPIAFLKECIESVIAQSYPYWQLILADDASTDPQVSKTIKAYAKKDKRIIPVIRQINGHISEASNSALEAATGDFIALLDHDDILHPHALYKVAQVINEHPEVEFIYSDEDKLEEDGVTRVNPFFKPDWSPDYLRSINYITHLAVIKTQIVKKVGGFRRGYEGAQDWDLFLRTTAQTKHIYHIPDILYSWRKSPHSTASEKHVGEVKPYAYINQKKALFDDLRARGLAGTVLETEMPGQWRVSYDITGNPKVSIIIPSKDSPTLITACIESILSKSQYGNYEIVIVDTGSTDSSVLRYYQKLKKDSARIKILMWKKPFNFSAVCNFGAKQATGDYYLFLNNDTEVITPDWIEGLLEHAQNPWVGSVGAKLYYKDNTIQHLGGILGIPGDSRQEKGRAGHAYRGLRKNFMHHDRLAVKNYSFVTAACVLVAKEKFWSINGFNEDFAIAFNDVDLGLRLYTQKGLFNVVNPFVELYHYEGQTIFPHQPWEKNRDQTEWNKELALLIKTWDHIRLKDPFYNPNLSLGSEKFDHLNI